ncbi:MAG: glycosyltransferase family 4 protein [Pseudomonadota bacterium]
MKFFILITEDWFAASHFKPLIRAALEVVRPHGGTVHLVTRRDKRADELAELGAEIIDFDFARGPIRALTDTAVLLRLITLLARHKPDVVHAVALKPIALTLAARKIIAIPQVAFHLTGTGLAGTLTTQPSPNGANRAPAVTNAGGHDTKPANTPATARHLTRGSYGFVLKRLAGALQASNRSISAQTSARSRPHKSVHLFVENEDDVDLLQLSPKVKSSQVTLLGGAGVDPDAFPAAPLPPTGPLTIAFVGRMVWSKGLHVLKSAHDDLIAQGRTINLVLVGAPDPANPNAIPEATLQQWCATPHVTGTGWTSDVRSIWQTAHVCVVPSLGGEGLPRSLLEAAACGRAIIASDVPGCRRFVRDGTEGLVVPPGDTDALATAIATLDDDRALLKRNADAARARLLDGFTEADVERAVVGAYQLP